MNRLLPTIILISLASPAFAHAHLLSEVPTANAVVVAAPKTLTLSFSEAVELHFTGVKVTGPAGAAVTLGTASLDPRNDKVLEVPLAGGLAPGAYAVAWHALSTDGHKTNGTYTFTVK